MKSSRIDRLFTIFTATVLVVWSGCLVFLWARAFGAGGESMLITLAATALAIGLAMSLPGRFARGVHRVLVWTRLQDVLTMELVLAGAPGAGRNQARTLSSLLGEATIFAVFCAMAATAAALIGPAVAGELRGLLWGRWAWMLLRLAVQVVGMGPMGLAFAVTFLAGTMVRGGSGRDTYGTVFRDWLWSVGLGLGIFALAWWAGANLVGLAAVAGLPLFAAAVAFIFRQRVTARPRRQTRAIDVKAPPGAGIVLIFAAVTAALVVQARFLGDLAGLGLSVTAGWAAVSVFGLVMFLGRADRKSHLPGAAQHLAAQIALPAGVLMQVALLAMGLSPGPVAGVCILLAGLGQIPLAALAAVVLSRQRRVFAGAGGRAGGYAARVCCGVGAGLLTLLAALTLPWGRVLLFAAALAICAAAVIRGISIVSFVKRQVRWAAWGSALICACTATVLAARAEVRAHLGTVSGGVWLSSLVSSSPPGRPASLAGHLPARRTWRSAGVGDVLADVLSDNPGRWWVVAGSDRDWPALGPGAWAVWSAPDPSCIPPGVWRGKLRAGGDGDFLRIAQMGRELYDGVLLSPLPADHPQAWRCYNDRTLPGCVERVHPGRPILLRTQVAGDSVEALLAVAVTFRNAVAGARPAAVAEGRLGLWAVIAPSRDAVDMLLLAVAGDGPPAPPDARGEGVFVLSLGRLAESWPGIQPIRLTSPGGAWRPGRFPLNEFRPQLREAAELPH